MSQTAALDQDTTDTVGTDDLTAELRTLGLAGCIDALTAPLRRQGLLVRWETPHHGVEISTACAVLLYRAAQELLSNVSRHSHATGLTVRLAATFHGIRLAVTDNGIGFSVADQTPVRGNHGYGLCLMSMAVHEANGSITVDSTAGHGTRVSITLPLD